MDNFGQLNATRLPIIGHDLMPQIDYLNPKVFETLTFSLKKPCKNDGLKVMILGT